MIVAIVLFYVYFSKEKVSPDMSITEPNHPENKDTRAYLYAAVSLFLLSLGFMIAFTILAVRGNPCKAKRQFAYEIMNKELQKQGFFKKRYTTKD
jgi:hypothetical protein